MYFQTEIESGESEADSCDHPHQKHQVDIRQLHDFVLEPKAKKAGQEPTGWQYMADMVRATICVDSIPQLWDAYTWFKKSGPFEIVKIKDKLTSDLKNITVIFDFDSKIIGELQFRYEPIPPQYYANHLLYELERSNSHLEFI